MRNDAEKLARALKAMYPTKRDDEPASDVHYRDGYNTAINQVACALYSLSAEKWFDSDAFKAASGHECSHRS